MFLKNALKPHSFWN